MIRPLVLVAAIMISGCATIDSVQHSDDVSVYEQHIQSVAAIDHWEIKGRLSARTENKGDISRILWQRAHDQHRLELYGTFGSRRLRIFQDIEGVTLEDTQGSTIEGTSVRQVISERTGWELPVEELIHWMVGSVNSDLPADVTWDINGHPISIVQSGWDVSLANYRLFGQYMLPTRLTAKRFTHNEAADSDSGSSDSQYIEIRLVISDWGI